MQKDYLNIDELEDAFLWLSNGAKKSNQIFGLSVHAVFYVVFSVVWLGINSFALWKGLTYDPIGWCGTGVLGVREVLGTFFLLGLMPIIAIWAGPMVGQLRRMYPR